MGKRKRNHILRISKARQELSSNPILKNENSVVLEELNESLETPDVNVTTLQESPFETDPPKKVPKKTPTKRKTSAKKTTTRRKKPNSSK